MDEPIVLPEDDDALATELNDRIDDFQRPDDGDRRRRLLQAQLRDEEGELVAGRHRADGTRVWRADVILRWAERSWWGSKPWRERPRAMAKR